MGMSRKIQKLRMLREGQRKSPRISALDVCKAQQRSNNVPVVTQRQQSSSTSKSRNNTALKQKKELDHAVTVDGGDNESKGRAKKKRKLKPLQDVTSSPYDAPKNTNASSAQDDKQQSHMTPNASILPSSSNPKQKNQTSSPDQLSRMPSALWLPEKRILELIIDILQRKDSNEFFAEPVDADEVEDYYKIIKDPMDFGTMRAKLHEGLYKSLGQFERDIFLITANAMHFNTSGTVYFRQARAIGDLAKKVFHALKTDPKNFEMEFSGTRRRSGRRPLQPEARNAICNSSLKSATNSRSNSRKPHSSPKLMDSSINGLSVLRKSRLNSSCSDSGDYGLLFDGTSSEGDRRSSYAHHISFMSEKHSTPASYSGSKLLVHVNQQDIGYCESLMLFAKDLGPTAQMIAKRKIMQCTMGTANLWSSGCASGATNSPNYTALSSGQWNCTAQEITSTSNFSYRNQMFVSDEGKGAWPCNRAHGTLIEAPSLDNAGARFDKEFGSTAIDVMSIGRIDNFLLNVGEGSYASATSNAKDFSLPVSELSSSDERSASLKPDKSKIDNVSASSDRNLWPNSSQWKLHENLSLPPSSCTGIFSLDQKLDCTGNLNWPHAPIRHQISADEGTNNELGLCERQQDLKSSEEWKPVSNFTFDLPFLKNRLDERNPDRLTGRHSVFGSWNAVVERPCYSSLNNLDNKHSNLVLRL